MTDKKENSARGRDSFDANIAGTLISFINKNESSFSTEVGAPKFDLVPIEKQKDIMLNVARLHARQEYDRIMELVKVLQKQADSIKRRLEITDSVHQAKYDFQLYHNNCYWLVWDNRVNIMRLVKLGPSEWNTGIPLSYNYVARVKWLGDHTWIEVDNEGNSIE